MEEISVQKVGTREDSEKKTYEPYTSWERDYEATMWDWGVGVRKVLRTMNVFKSTQI